MLNKLLPILLLVGCSQTAPTSTILTDARTELIEIASDIQKLPEQCQTDSIVSRLNHVYARLDAAQETHELQLKNCQSEMKEAKAYNYIMFFIIAAALATWLKKKVLK